MIYLFDKKQNIIGVLKENELISGKLIFKINTAINFEFTVTPDKAFDSNVKYVSTPHPKDKNKHLLFRIMSRIDNVNNVEYTAGELAYQELSSTTYIEDKRPSETDAKTLMTLALEGSQWSLGTVNVAGKTNTNFYYVTNLEAIQNVVSLMGGEIVFYVTITGNKITGRFMDYLARQGEDTSKVFAQGSNLLSVVRKNKTDSIYTAILPRGKGEQVSEGEGDTPDGYGRRINISEIVWDKTKGNPLNKPHGSLILEDTEATAEWGQINGSARLLLQTYDEVDDVNILMQQAYQTLMSVNHPQIQYSATVAKVGNLSLGDTVLIMHSERKLSYKTRVFEVNYDLTNPENTELSLGDDLSSNSITSQINNISKSVSTNSNQTQWNISNGGHNSTNYGPEEPSNARKGDVWFKSLPNGNTEEYYFDGSIWILGSSTDQQWKENKAIQQGSNTVFYGPTMPSGAIVGDTWFKNDNNEPDGKAMYTYSGTTWVKFNGSYDASRLTIGEINGKLLDITNIDTTNLVGDIDGKLNKITNVDTSALVGGLDGTKNPLSNVPANQLVGTMNKEVVNTINLNAEQITSGKLNSEIINAIELNAGQITSGQLNSNIVNTIELNANQITSGQLNSNIVNAISIDASQIKTGKLNSDIVESIEIDAKQIVAGQIDASKINVYNINADKIISGSIDASKINVLNLSADNIVTGELSANFIKGGQLDFSQINGININVDSLVGNISEFIQTNWDGEYGSTKITSTGMQINTKYVQANFIDFGMEFSYSNKKVGGMGISQYSNGTPGLAMRLDGDGGYMSWSARNKGDTTGTYANKLGWFRQENPTIGGNYGFIFEDRVTFNKPINIEGTSINLGFRPVNLYGNNFPFFGNYNDLTGLAYTSNEIYMILKNEMLNLSNVIKSLSGIGAASIPTKMNADGTVAEWLNVTL